MTNPNKINFYFDKNIWSEITNKTDSELAYFADLTKQLINESKIGIYYSPVSVLELIKGMFLEKHYDLCKKEIRLASILTNKHFLEYPWDHVRRIVYASLHIPFKEVDLQFLNLSRKIAIGSYAQVEPIIAATRDMMGKWETGWSDSLNQISMSFNHLDPKEAKRDKGDFWLNRKRKALWPRLLQQFSLFLDSDKLPFDEGYKRFHSLRYCLDYRITYQNKLLFEYKKARPSDYLDWIQLVYLNIMDYLVTNDSKLITVLNECENHELNNVSMRFSEFQDCLEGKLPKKRAPDSIYEKWYDAQ